MMSAELSPWSIIVPIILFIGWFFALWRLVKLLRDEAKEMDEMMNPTEKEAFAKQLLETGISAKAGVNPTWLIRFNITLDDVFGHKHFSWQCFWRSAVISICSFMLLITLLVPVLIIKNDGIDIRGILYVVILALVFNLLVDFISLAETRWLLRSPSSLWLRLGLDSIATVGIWAIGTLLCIILIVQYNFWVEGNSHVGLFDQLAAAILLLAIYELIDPVLQTLWCSLLTSFTTSAWLWIHTASVVTLRPLAHLPDFKHKINEYPHRTLVHVFSGWIVVVGLAGYIIAYYFGWSNNILSIVDPE